MGGKVRCTLPNCPQSYSDNVIAQSTSRIERVHQSASFAPSMRLRELSRIADTSRFESFALLMTLSKA
jgi:hypothetical protein